MLVTELALPGVLLIERRTYDDLRGSFTELFNPEILSVTGSSDFSQDNLSTSKCGVIRGMHWQEPPFSQGKLISCIEGRILDVVLVCDLNSFNYGSHIEVELDSTRNQSLWIPKGYAHGFEVLSNRAMVHYKVDSPRNMPLERRINPLTSKLKNIWRTKTPIVSKLDLAGLDL